MIHQGVASVEEHVGHTLLFGELPHALLVVQVRSVLGQPKNTDVLPNLRVIQEGGALLRRMDGAGASLSLCPLSRAI